MSCKTQKAPLRFMPTSLIAAIAMVLSMHTVVRGQSYSNSSSGLKDASKSILVLPIGVHGEAMATAERRLTSLTEALGRVGAGSFEPEVANFNFETRVSRGPHVVAAGVAKEISECDANNLGILTLQGKRLSNEQAFNDCIDPVSDAIESISSSPELAQAVLDTCLHQVTLLMNSKKASMAKLQAFECRRMVPEGQPSHDMHKPAMIGFMAQADAELAALPVPDLHVDAERPGCDVVVNGLRRGTTPLTASDLPAGPNFVQVDCRNPARIQETRVHVIDLPTSGKMVSLYVDTRFDRVVRSGEFVSLQYSSDAERGVYGFQDAVQIARTLGTKTAWTITADAQENKRTTSGNDIIRLDRINVDRGEVLASIWLHDLKDPTLISVTTTEAIRQAHKQNQSFKIDEYDHVADTIAWQPTTSSKQVGALAPTALSAAATPTDASRQETGSSRSSKTVGWVLMGTGAVSFGVAGGLYLKAYLKLGSGTPYEPSPVLGYASVAGALLTTAGLVELLPEHKGIPAWSWPAGVVGAGLVAYGVVVMAQNGKTASCTLQGPNECLIGETYASIGQGLFIAGVGLPLLSIPIIYAMRGAASSKNENTVKSLATANKHKQGAKLMWNVTGQGLLVSGVF